MSSAFLFAHDLVKRYGARRVLDGVSLAASPGQRVGLVGENGAGKSTLLRLLAGVESPDSGEVIRPADTGLLHQELPFPGDAVVATVIENALSAIRARERRLRELAERLQQQPEDTEALDAYGEVLAWFEAHDGWHADRRAEEVLAALGLDGVAQERRLETLSGGERSRLAMAALLLRQPEVLLLDEPTNHLDDDAISFVEAHLRRLPGAVVVASHDRVFLDAVCTDIYDLDPSRDGVTRYGGAYSEYLHHKRTEHRRWEQAWQEQRREIADLHTAVRTTARTVAYGRPMRDRNKTSYDRHGGRVDRAVSRRVRDAKSRLDELQRNQVPKPRPPLRLRATMGAGASGESPILSLRRVQVPGRLVIDQLDIAAHERLLVTGPNGAGKSTLLGVLGGRLRPDRGFVHRRRGLRVGLLEQDVWFAEPCRTPRQIYAAVTDADGLVGLGLVAPAELDRPVGELSAGQRRRLALALLVGRAPHVLLLDEPTNHLSLTLVEELEEALRTAPGAIVAASHDRWLRSGWDGRELPLEHGTVRPDDTGVTSRWARDV